MKNPILITLGVLLLFVFSLQVVMLYEIHEKLDQEFMKEKELDLSSHQGSNTWVESDDNWNPYQELLQVRNRMEQILNDSISRLHHNSNTTPFTHIAAIDFKNEVDRYVVTLDVPGADESALNVTLNGRILTVTIKIEGGKDQSKNGNTLHLHEQFKGEFYRTLTLPGEVNKEKMKTSYNNGILTITLPKT